MSDRAISRLSTTTASSSVGPSVLLQRKCGCGTHTSGGGECADCGKKNLQRKLSIGASNSPLELEADRVADQVMAALAHPFVSATPPRIQRFSNQSNGPMDAAPACVERVLASPGRPLEPTLQQDMGQRFSHDFSQVRVHMGAAAEESARDVNALAYTVGPNIVFGARQFSPATYSGRRLIAHELTHVVQQSGADRARTGTNGNQPGRPQISHNGSGPTISRADRDAVGYTMRLGTSARTGIQFWPTNITDTQVGPVTAQGGLRNGVASRLNVIIGANLTLRMLARQLLPLWTTATPFTPAGAAVPLPLDVITVDELAQGLLVFNQTYLSVPGMTNWRSGLRLPLPVDIDDATGVATLHPLQIRALASGFDPAWAPLLDSFATATTALPTANVHADVKAFLARETTALARGVHLGAKALTNAVAELPFIRESFHQLGAAAFDVAIAFMDNVVNREISLLAAQRDGAAILAEVRTVLAAAPPTLTTMQQTSLDRANLMFGLVAGVAAQAPPGATRIRSEKTITVDTVKLDGSSHSPSTDVAVADAILSQCNVRVRHGVNASATNAQTIGWLGGNTDLRASAACGTATPEEKSLFSGAASTFAFGARFRGYFPATLSGLTASGYSVPPFCATGSAAPFRNVSVVVNSGDTASLAHELAHILRNSGTHPAGTIAGSRPAPPLMRQPLLTNPQCTAIYTNA